MSNALTEGSADELQHSKDSRDINPPSLTPAWLLPAAATQADNDPNPTACVCVRVCLLNKC